MPIHDWSRIPAGIFHHFHQHWTIEITSVLNRVALPKGLAAMIEQRAGPKEADVLTVEEWGRNKLSADDVGGLLTQDRPVMCVVRKDIKADLCLWRQSHRRASSPRSDYCRHRDFVAGK